MSEENIKPKPVDKEKELKKLKDLNKKVVKSKTFSIIFISLVVFIIAASSYLIYGSTDFFKEKNETTPKVSDEKYQELEKALDQAIIYSKDNSIKAISILENYGTLPKQLEDRKNYILAKLYREINEIALAYITADRIKKKYLPKYSKILKADLAQSIGLEAIVVESYEYLSNKYNDPAYKYELAKSYLRQNLKEDAKKLFEEIPHNFPNSEYAIGSLYYLANLTTSATERITMLRSYLEKSPTGNLSYLVSKQYENFNAETKEKFNDLNNNLALSYHKQGLYQKAVNHFDPSHDRPEFFIMEYADSLARLKRKSDARRLLVDEIPKLTNKEKAKEAIEKLVSLSNTSQAIANLKTLEGTVSNNLKDKVLWELAKKTHSKEDYARVYKEFPKSFYAAESMSRVFWKEYKRKSFHRALDIAKEHWANYDYANSHAFVAFWSAKIYLQQKEENKAKESLQNLIISHPRDYYSYRAKQILAQEKDWYKLPSSNKFTSFPTWKWPDIYNDKQIKEKYGEEIAELIKLHEYRFILDLKDKKEIEINKPFMMWLYAKDGNYLKAISTAYFSLKENESLNYKKAEFQYAYPLAYTDLITDEVSNRARVDPMLVHALIKQESRYQKDIVSKVGAIGLMQLMPYTAKSLARSINIKPPRPYDLMQAETNIKLGIRYMEQVFADFDNNMIYAIASYNAGPTAIKTWKTKYGEIDGPNSADEFIEKIPYPETKGYVKHVLNNYWIYRDLYS